MCNFRNVLSYEQTIGNKHITVTTLFIFKLDMTKNN